MLYKTPEESATLHEIFEALESERKRQGLSMAAIDKMEGMASGDWRRMLRREELMLAKLIRVCKHLDVELLLVNNQGDNLL